MTVGPRIVFTRFVSGDSPKLQPWISHLKRTLRTNAHHAIPALDGLQTGAVVWQLVSGNSRQLGRSSRIFGSFESASADAQRIIARAADLETVLISEHLRGVYGWYAAIDGEPAVTSARWYETERDRARSIALALTSLATAALQPGSRLVDASLMREGT